MKKMIIFFLLWSNLSFAQELFKKPEIGYWYSNESFENSNTDTDYAYPYAQFNTIGDVRIKYFRKENMSDDRTEYQSIGLGKTFKLDNGWALSLWNEHRWDHPTQEGNFQNIYNVKVSKKFNLK